MTQMTPEEVDRLFVGKQDKYTPGPWHVHKHYPFWVESADDRGVADLEGRGQPETVKANARLIAAAPELLAACRQAYDALNELLGADYDCAGDMAILRAAIEKATI